MIPKGAPIFQSTLTDERVDAHALEADLGNSEFVVYRADYVLDRLEFGAGAPPERLFGRPHLDSYEAFRKSLDIIDVQVRGLEAGIPIGEASQLFRDGKIDRWKADLHIRHDDGSVRWISDMSAPVRDADGNVIGAVGIFVDVTDRYRVYHALSEIVEQTATTGEDFLQKLVLAISSSLQVKYAMIAGVDQTENVATTLALSFDGQIVPNMSYSLVGTPCSDVISSDTCFFPRDVANLFPEDHLLVEMGVTSYLGTSIVSSDGKFLGILVILHDKPLDLSIDPRRVLKLFANHAGAELSRMEAERRIRESEERYRTFFSSTSVGILVQDGHQRILACNSSAAMILGVTEDILTGAASFKPDWEAIREDGSPMPMSERPTAITMATGCATRNVIMGLKKPSGVTWISVNSEPLSSTGDGQSRQVVTSFEDITQRIDAKNELSVMNSHLQELVDDRTKELHRSMKELESFTYSVSHDLRGPLRAIDGFAQILDVEYGAGLDEDAKDCLVRIRGAARRMSSIIDDLLRLSRLSFHELDLSVVDISELAKSQVENMRRSGLCPTCEVNIQEGMKVTADAKLMSLVIQNLIENAAKYSEFSDTKSLSVSMEDGVIVVEDKGIGFDMKYAEKLFAPFERLHSNAEYEGTGIGLSIVKRIIERHHGTIWATGEPGKGASFFFQIPGQTSDIRTKQKAAV